LIAGLRDAGLRVPDDISISGFDNLPASATCAVPLTTIAVPMPEMLDTVGQHLLSETNLDGDILIPGHIIERASVGEARRTAAA
ncbi:MAG TPA: substrate-binding domain-containing protein, partial [Armatimonadota bacterium]|nr:substrate-binding domain-containing protein [Armatimonadota bacterium]